MGTEIAGLGFAVVIGAGWMLRYIMKRDAERDNFLQELTTNHLAHSTKALIELRNAIQNLEGAIRAMGKD